MISLPEKFLIYFFLYFFLFLLFAGVVVLVFIIRRKDISKTTFHNIFPAVVRKKRVRTESKEIKSKFTEKLGERIVQFMIEVAHSDNEAIVRDRIQKIERECERLNSRSLPDETKEIISTVLLWSKKFNLDRHIREMKILKRSTQIAYDKKKRDFKLLIPSE
ncbi:MAG: hypothetical protein ACP5QT_07150 [Brevinematia bacterium]